MNTIQFLDEHLFPGQLGYFLTILSLVASLVATYSFARAFFSKEISLRAQWEKLAKIALDGLSRLPGCYFGGGALKTLGVFSDHFIERGRVPASDLLDEFSRRGVLDLECFKRVEAEWRQTLDRERDPATLSD